MKIFDWLKFRNWEIVKVYRDFENFNDWKKTIKREKANPKSLFNRWKLQHTKLYDVFVVISLEDADAQLPEDVQRTKVIEMLNPLHRYLDDDLKFAECLDCEFNQYVDDKGVNTLSYLIVYKFHWVKFSIKWLLKFLIINGTLLFVILKFDLINKLVLWIKLLI